VLLLETNGQQSTGQWTQHCNVQYYFVADKAKNSKIKIKYCLTKEMVADILTKLSRQGAAFLILRQKLLNLPDELSGVATMEVHRSVLDDQQVIGKASREQTFD
jgi:hypothetical protein